MVGPRVEPGRVPVPSALEMVAPGARIGAGVLMLAMGVTGVIMEANLWSLVLLGAAAMIGLPALISGLGDRRRQRIERGERVRAEQELPRLRAEIAACVARNHNVSRLLKQQGYTSARVRRWIALECDVVLSAGDG
ncbi:MAG: hypothetical protein KDC98_26215 [Planctomycetes bacterium]|nr:hypothetical protein [Planctomycetota bacterium]